MNRIRTPRGKYLTPRRYLALADAQNTRSIGGGPSCALGHYGCAAWEGGPCSDELVHAYGLHECEHCGERGTPSDPVEKHVTSPPVSGYPVEEGWMHTRCANEAARKAVE